MSLDALRAVAARLEVSGSLGDAQVVRIAAQELEGLQYAQRHFVEDLRVQYEKIKKLENEVAQKSTAPR